MKVGLQLILLLLFTSAQTRAQMQPRYPEAPEKWSKPEPIFCKAITDSFDRAEKPTVTADGKTLYFGSIWVTHFTDTGWSMPEYLPKRMTDPNYAGADHPIISPSGRRLFFSWFVGAWLAFYSDWDNAINDWGPVQDPGPAINYSPNPDLSPGADAGCFLDDTTLIVLKGGESYITRWHSSTSSWDSVVSWPYRFSDSTWDGLRFNTDWGIAVTQDRWKVYVSLLRSDTTRDGKYYGNYDLQVFYRDKRMPAEYAGKMYTLNISFLSDSLYFAGVDSGRFEGFPTITADGKTLFFAADYRGMETIYVSHLVLDENGDSVNDVISRPSSVFPRGYRIYPAYPNPFNPTTTVTYSIPVRSDIRLILYDVLGRRIRTLTEGTQSPGEHHLTLDSTGLSSGIYFLLLETPRGVLTSKIALIK